jgi:hypothetical protein
MAEIMMERGEFFRRKKGREMQPVHVVVVEGKVGLKYRPKVALVSE